MILVGILLVVGLSPVFFSLKIEAYERTRVILSIKFFWGLFTLQFPNGRQKQEKALAEPAKPKTRKTKEKSILRFIVKCRKKILVAIRGTLKHLRFRSMQGSFEFGFDDPAMTGEVLGVVASVGVWLPKCCGLDLAPNFMRKVFRGDGQVLFYVIPLFVLFAAIYFWSILALNYFYFNGSRR